MFHRIDVLRLDPLAAAPGRMGARRAQPDQVGAQAIDSRLACSKLGTRSREKPMPHTRHPHLHSSASRPGLSLRARAPQAPRAAYFFGYWFSHSGA
ncbi:hypothetical protein [Pseudomonas aeruginosa]|uniref:hypothetical protein n=1 Tax=Pseudomonas aeruginosa TaxID=287 RepID=UPI003D2A0D50